MQKQNHQSWLNGSLWGKQTVLAIICFRNNLVFHSAFYRFYCFLCKHKICQRFKKNQHVFVIISDKYLINLPSIPLFPDHQMRTGSNSAANSTANAGNTAGAAAGHNVLAKTSVGFLENLNARLAEQRLSGKAFAVRSLINSKALVRFEHGNMCWVSVAGFVVGRLLSYVLVLFLLFLLYIFAYFPW